MCMSICAQIVHHLMGVQPEFDLPAVVEHTLHAPACNDAVDGRISFKTKHLMQIQRKGQRTKIRIQ